VNLRNPQRTTANVIFGNQPGNQERDPIFSHPTTSASTASGASRDQQARSAASHSRSMRDRQCRPDPHIWRDLWDKVLELYSLGPSMFTGTSCLAHW
jgi:hypothetical protein